MKPARKNSNGIYVSIRSKLVAAVAMLLVASFMVVSSSYAWFTLSTAPEVTGIHTAVGANGNLEIALDEGQEPGTGVGFGGNNNWGNLIDLNNAIYGLDKITLMPAALNVMSEMKMDTGVPLKVPQYGNDGRVISMEGTIMATADQHGVFKNDKGTGVRAIGTSSGMSPQKLDYRSAMSQISACTAQIKLYASKSLEDSGGQLATAVVGYASSSGDVSKTYDINKVEGMITSLTNANEEIVKMIKAYFKALVAYVATEKGLDEEAYRTLQNSLDAMSVENLFASQYGQELSETSQIKKLYAKYQTINAAITTAAAEVAYYKTDGRTLTQVPWEETDGTVSHGVKAIFINSGLVKLNDMQVNGFPANKDLLTNNEVISSILSGGVTLEMGSNCGVYSDFAEIAGNYTVAITIAEISYGETISVKDFPAKMATTIDGAPTIKISSELLAPADGVASTEISDFYGYAIDLQFRTNAKDSHLMLQTTPTNRIYSSGGSEETAGHGSTMTFKTSDTTFTTDDVRNLMKFIRVVFVQEGDIIGVGILGDDTVVEGDTVIGNIYLVKFTTPSNDGGKTYSLELTKKQGTDEYDFINTNEKGATKLISLAQNTVAKLSVYVYLDGENLSNGDVAATSATSMTGSLNLQFSSDANLVPMEYAALRDPLADEGATETSATTQTETTQPTESTTGSGQ